ncbi:hypothetical protein O181_029526 [Austropuccinia psidii MF-1]|uniref:Secreted protein n=1 Tax=Austropuccinia psidii MF-1 TaxID=1389203 RepID=A0A9Q3CR72_9BASI|nr:hypothetical protein [Austropuccinia psidii MF-1]
MRFAISTMLLAFSASQALAQDPDHRSLRTHTNKLPLEANKDSSMPHTLCYNYFKDKDGCVWSSAGSERCKPKTTSNPNVFGLPAGLAKKLFNAAQNLFATSKTPLFPPPGHVRPGGPPPDPRKRGIYKSVERRYDAQPGVGLFPLEGGNGVCGYYDSNKEVGVCLWTGTSSTDRDNTTMGKPGWLNKADTRNCKKHVYLKRPGMNQTLYVPVLDGCDFGADHPKDGCVAIGFTKATFDSLNPTADEIKNQRIEIMTWDFDNEHGAKPDDGPV